MPTPFDGLDPADYVLPDDFAARCPSPALLVHLDRVRENLRRVLGAAGGDPDRWRPHVKTVKIPAVLAEYVRAGIRCFKCATTREAAVLAGVLAAEGVDRADVLLAYPLLGPALDRLDRLAAAHSGLTVSVLCEDPGAIPSIPEALGVFVDVNPGMNRTGVPAEDGETIRAIAAGAGERFRGVHFYDGHLNDGDAASRRAEAFACYDRLVEIVRALEGGGHPVSEIVTSGTPTFLHALAYAPFAGLENVVHRISPGTVAYHDERTEARIVELDLLPAALLFARVVSRPTAGIVTCDAGSKSIAAEAGDPCAFALGHPELVALEPSEEHLPFRVTSGDGPARGMPLHLVPRHVCPTVNLAEEAVLLEAGRVIDVVRVAARAHDLSAGIIAP